MRVVFDTNVLVSAALKNASLPALAVRLATGRGRILKSSQTEREVLGVLARPRIGRLVPPAADAWVRSVLAGSELVPVASRVAMCRDPGDDMFLALALDGRADMVVSGDGDLLDLHPFGYCAIVSPAAFVALVGARGPLS